jgi:hypothetical protein
MNRLIMYEVKMYLDVCLNCSEFSDRCVCFTKHHVKCECSSSQTKLEFILEIEGDTDTLEIEKPRSMHPLDFLEKCFLISRRHNYTVYAKCFDVPFLINSKIKRKDLKKECYRLFPSLNYKDRKIYIPKHNYAPLTVIRHSR